MRRSFYHYVLTLRSPLPSEEATFANHVSRDIQFPKQSEDYHELSSYLEMNVDYVTTMALFDEIWEKYLAFNQ